MKEKEYLPRIIDAKIEEYLAVFGAVCIEGPKWCGKTWTSSHHSKSEIFIGDPAGNFQNRKLAELSPALVLNGEKPRLIDEWQEVPSIWDAVLEDDVYHVDEVKRNLSKMRLLLRSLARNESTTATNKKLRNDIRDIDSEDIDVETVAEYLDIFSRLYITDNLPPFSTRIRSSVRVKQAEKRHFCDPSLACALLKVTPDSLLGDLETLGFLFEALCERDLKIYAEALGANLYHYQDYQEKEMDVVIELSDGSWGAFEIKLGANQIDVAADNLLAIKAGIEKDGNGKLPKFLCVICGMSNAAYQREDGVYVVPITALKP